MKDQVKAAVVCVALRIVVGVTVKKLATVALSRLPGALATPLPLIATASTEAVTMSLRSKSVTVNEPLVVKPDPVGDRPTESGPSVITGESLVPVMVIVTVSVALHGAPSSSVALAV